MDKIKKKKKSSWNWNCWWTWPGWRIYVFQYTAFGKLSTAFWPPGASGCGNATQTSGGSSGDVLPCLRVICFHFRSWWWRLGQCRNGGNRPGARATQRRLPRGIFHCLAGNFDTRRRLLKTKRVKNLSRCTSGLSSTREKAYSTLTLSLQPGSWRE